MTGYGLTVFAGSEPDTFGVTVVGVQPRARVQGSMIMIEVSGHGLETSAIARGMSGSPIFIEGRLAGALAFGWEGALRPIAGVTPIGEMFAVATEPASSAQPRGMGAAAATSPNDLVAGLASGALAAELLGTDATRVVPTTAALPTGWAPPTVVAEALLADLFPGHDAPGAWICAPTGAAPAPAAAGAAGTAAPLRPGSACAVPLVLGDALLGSVGTVTWVDDAGHVWAFGHPFMQRGAVALPLATAEILTMFPSRRMSFKMGSIGDVVGTVHRDQRAGLVGELGATPPTVQVNVTVADPAGRRAYAFEVAEDPLLLPALVFWSAYNALLAEADDASLQTVRYSVETRWDAPGFLGRDGLAFSGAAVGPSGAAQLGPQFMAPLQILLLNPHAPVALRGVDIALTAEPALEDARVVAISGPVRLPATGGSVDFTVEIEPRRGGRLRVPVTLDVPPGLDAGRYRVAAASAAEVFALEAQRAAGIFAPASLDATVRLIASERSPQTLTVALFAPGSGVVVEGQELDALPGSVARTVRRGVESSQRTLADTVGRTDLPLDYVLEGHAVHDVRVERTAPPLTVEKRP